MALRRPLAYSQIANNSPSAKMWNDMARMTAVPPARRMSAPRALAGVAGSAFIVIAIILAANGHPGLAGILFLLTLLATYGWIILMYLPKPGFVRPLAAIGWGTVVSLAARAIDDRTTLIASFTVLSGMFPMLSFARVRPHMAAVMWPAAVLSGAVAAIIHWEMTSSVPPAIAWTAAGGAVVVECIVANALADAIHSRRAPVVVCATAAFCAFWEASLTPAACISFIESATVRRAALAYFAGAVDYFSRRARLWPSEAQQIIVDCLANRVVLNLQRDDIDVLGRLEEAPWIELGKQGFEAAARFNPERPAEGMPGERLAMALGGSCIASAATPTASP